MFKAIIILMLVALTPFTALAKPYTISAGDKLTVSVVGEPEYQTETTVRPDGKIDVRSLGDVDAVGLTAEQVQDAITNKLKEYIRQPVVTVSLMSMGNSKIFVTGGGVKATVVDASQVHTLLSLLTGLGDTSAVDMHNATVVRDGVEIKKDFNDLIVGGNIDQDIPLMAGDTVNLPPTASNRGVYVVGAVNSPKVVVYREGLTILEALLEAGGYSKFASPNDTRVIRQTDGKEQVIKIKGNHLMHDGDMKENIVLHGGDLVIVDESFF